jgi:hypothetical protein
LYELLQPQVQRSIIPSSAHTTYVCVLYGSQNKQRFFLYAALNYCFFMTETESVYCAVRAESLNIDQGDPIAVLFRLPLNSTDVFRAFSSIVRQMPGYTSQRRGTARTLPN